MVNLKKGVLFVFIILFSSCITFKKEFVEFEKKIVDLNPLVLSTKGYYITKTKTENNKNPRDSVCVIKNPIILYDNGKALVSSYSFSGFQVNEPFDFSKRKGENTFESANLEFIKHIEKYNLKESKHSNGAFRIENDTIIIQYNSRAIDKPWLIELKGVIQSDTNFMIYKRKVFKGAFLHKEINVYDVKINYEFKNSDTFTSW